MPDFSSDKPELIVGFVGAAGTDLDLSGKAVASALTPYGYEVVPIRLSKLMRDVKGGDRLARSRHEDERIWEHMDAGDAIRLQCSRNDAIAGLAVGSISDLRREVHGGAPAMNTAFVLNSLKHPAEVEAMRRIYRDRFVLISVHSPTEARLQALQQRIASSRGAPDKEREFSDASHRIMRRDQHDDERGGFGQNVREAFTLGDVYVSMQPSGELGRAVARYFRLFFGDPFVTPTADEYAMFQTHVAALRSADLSRQVGAAVCTTEGEIIAVGCNEVPKAFGGQYWPDDDPDKRDFQLGYDSNAKYRDKALEDALQRLRAANQVSADVDLAAFMASVSKTRLANLTEFGRPVHAEMAALLDAARRGVAVAQHRLFSTTFPCHNCARHIVGAGVKEVVYREPYEKSLASELHEDSIVVDPAEPVDDKVVVRRFVGVGPPRYLDLFKKARRKDEGGNRVDWAEELARPRLVTTETAYRLTRRISWMSFVQRFNTSTYTRREPDGEPQRLARA